MSDNIIRDVITRTSGELYLGVVGSVRSGKSTFIRRFMELKVLPFVNDKDSYKRVLDELPQSGEGRNIMTVEPKFIPSEAIELAFGEGKAKVRLIDCVGYAVAGAGGFTDGDTPRFVKTPWSENEIPFEEAAEIGTRKVITEHSTIAVLVTTDGSITGISREAYEPAEEMVVRELKQAGKLPSRRPIPHLSEENNNLLSSILSNESEELKDATIELGLDLFGDALKIE